MSGLANLFEVPLNPTMLERWNFAHQAIHRDENAALYRLRAAGVRAFTPPLPDFILNPMEPKNMMVWLDQHQQMHNAVNTILNTSGFFLSEIKWEDQEEREFWIFQNATEHARFAKNLGL